MNVCTTTFALFCYFVILSDSKSRRLDFLPFCSHSIQNAPFAFRRRYGEESFLYLKHFYIGEVRRVDRETPGVVPSVPGPPASVDFLQQLREYTGFRLGAGVGDGEDDDEDGEEGEKVQAVHLGMRR